MKKQLFSLVSFFVASLFLFSSCSKDSDNPTPKSKTELISQGSWKFQSATVGGADASSMIQACQKDNVIVFAAAGTGTASEGATKCNAGDPDTVPFTWNFLNSETTLHISTVLFAAGSNDFSLVAVSETNLVVSQGFTFGGGPTQNVVVTFMH